MACTQTPSLLFLVALVAGSVSAWSQVSAQQADTVLLKGKVIDEQVVDPQGQRIAGALVRACYLKDSRKAKSLRPLITAADGTFKFDRSPSKLLLEAITPDGLVGFARASENDTDIEVHVGAAAAAKGRLLGKNGKPITAGYVRYGVRIPEEESMSGFMVFSGGAALLDSEGRFMLTGLAPGEEYVLQFTPPGDPFKVRSTRLGTFVPTAAETATLPNSTCEDTSELPEQPGAEELGRFRNRHQQIEKYITRSARGTDFDLIVQRRIESGSPETLPRIVADCLLRVPGVKPRNDELIESILVDVATFGEDDSFNSLVIGCNPGSALFKRLTFQPGSREFTWGDKLTVQLGSELASKLRKKVGDEIQLYGEKFKIVGIYDSPLAEEAAGLIVPLRELQSLHAPGEITVAFVSSTDPKDREALLQLQRRIELFQPGVEVLRARP